MLISKFNKFLGQNFGFNISRVSKPTSYEVKKIRNESKILIDNFKAEGYETYENLRYEVEDHEESSLDTQCSIMSNWISKLKPDEILDIGSYRHFLLGLLANCKVTTVDIRERKKNSKNETCLVGDALKLSSFCKNKFSLVMSQQTLQHAGLGRYGDSLDFDGPRKLMEEIQKVIEYKGHLIFSTTFTKRDPGVVFNSHRIYNKEQISSLTSGLDLVEEMLVDKRRGNIKSLKDGTTKKNHYDFYVGMYQKTQR